MKLVRFGEQGNEKPGIWVDDDRILDIQSVAFHIKDFDEHFFSNWGLEQLEALLTDPCATSISSKNIRLGAPIARPSKIICVGANYPAHAKEFGHEIPTEPILFSKATTALIGPTDPIILPSNSTIVDSEAEIAIVIGKRTRNISANEATSHIAGYMLLNDVTDREVQRKNGQWFLGKSPDTFCPAGPFLVTPDELPPPSQINIQQHFNNTCLQNAMLSEIQFSIPFLIEYISKKITLLPGDVISTGTPPGIGSARQPQILMKPNSVVKISATGLGAQCNCVTMLS